MDRLVAINLLIQLGVAAAVASALVRSHIFKNLLFTEPRSLSQTCYLVLWIGTPLALGGIMVGLPSAVHGSWLNLPFCIFAGVIAGKMRELTKDPEDIWSFSPFIDLSI